MVEEHRRPDPDQLLARVQAEEEQRRRGKLKIFLGYAAGVGKTYAMLEAARQRRAEGIDVVVALVETHGRAETERMLSALETIPRRKSEYRGTVFTEMDPDAVLARHPQLALVDELAHTNVPGSLHPKRYLDVERLLVAGIDVYTTLNIQHIESLNDVVAQITGITVRETVPDRLIDSADEVEVIDLPPEELLQRLREGKVYVPEQATRAIEKFFRRGNLTALREMALRRTAERVDEQLRAYMQVQAIPGPWAAGERLLVAVSPSPLGERLVRSAKRLADELRTEWFAVYVETAEYAHLSPAHRDRVAHTLALAEQLGAKVLTLSGQSVATTVLEYARTHNVTKIIIGQPPRSRFAHLWRGSVVDDLIRESRSIDVYVISGETEAPRLTHASGLPSHRPWTDYLLSAALVAGATVIGLPLQRLVFPTNLVMLYLVVVMVAAVWLGRGPSILTAALSVLAFDFFFVPPHYTFAVSNSEYLLTFAGLFLVSLVISGLAARAQGQAEVARRRQIQTAELCDFSQALASATSVETISRTVVTQLSADFGRQVVVLLPQADRLVPVAQSERLELDGNEMAVAAWAFQNGQPAGRGTDTLPAASARYTPLQGTKGVVGVLGVQPVTPAGHLTPEQRLQLQAYASQAALAIERAQLAESAREADLLQVTEKLQTALLNSISHDLRTPLASIIGILSSINDDSLDQSTRQNLIDAGLEEAQRLNRLMGNLMDMTRLDAGALKVSRELSDAQELVGSALGQLKERLRNRKLILKVPGDLPPVPMDVVLMGQVLVNLLDNALKYSPPDQPIEVQALAEGGEMLLKVKDRGVGIPPNDLENILNKFYRVQHPGKPGGTGLGLSICKGIVEAHGGRIWARNQPGGGAIFTVALPLQAQEETVL
jgi:two-component system sensor histidine kinase KdpD